MQVSDNHKQAKLYIKNIDSLNYEDLADAMTYKWFRLCSIYHIKNKHGRKVLFKPNIEQEEFYCDQHGRDIILKARQLGFTTFKMISDLDDCLFIENFSSGCICHNMDSAKDIFRNKIKFAYNNITDDQKLLISELGYNLPTATSDKGNAYVFSNGSSIKVGTSYRGDTLQSLHVSEFGKICKKYPEKANEIVTGAFEAVPTEGGVITLESTAEGKEGYFFQYCETAKKLKNLNKKLSILDFNFHFFSWWQRPEYEIDGDILPILEKYFNELEFKHNVKLNKKQKAWYSAKWSILGDDMRREYPSTDKEPFEQSISGAYYSQQFENIYKDGRITDLSTYNNKGDIFVQSDIGIGDSTALWFYRKVGLEIHLLHYYSNSGEGLAHYMKYIDELAEKNNWVIRQRYAPHDMNNREFGSNGKTRKELAREGIEFMGKIYRADFEIVPKLGVDDGIQLVRNILTRCIFDESCSEGISALESYRKEWNNKLGCWRDKPLHDWASDGADSFRYLAVTESKRINTTHSQRMIV